MKPIKHPDHPTALQKTSRSAAAIATLLLTSLLYACGGSSGSTPSTALTSTPDGATPTSIITPDPSLKEAGLAASTPGSMLDYVKQKIKTAAAQAATTNVLPVQTLASPATAASTSADSAGFSGTTLQEAGVDENDWVKTDGQLIYGLTKSYFTNGTQTLPQLQVQSRQADGQLTPVARLMLTNELAWSGMYLVDSARRVALLGQKFSPGNAVLAIDPIGFTTLMTSLTLPAPSTQISQIGIDLISTPSASTGTTSLSVVNRIRIDGTLVGSRVIGSTLYVVSNWTPNLSKFAITPSTSAAQADAVLAKLTNADVLPTIQIDTGAPEPLLADTDCYLQLANASVQTQITTITAFSLASPNLQRSSRCFVGGSQALYVSPAAVYVASSRFIIPVASGILPTAIFPVDTKTDIHKFAFSGSRIDYRGSGSVAGSLGWDADKVAYRMSEYQGDLRVLSFTGQQGWSFAINGATTSSTSSTSLPPASPATLSVLREASGSAPLGLQTVATLPNANRPAAIGKPNEQVYAVKYVGSRAYVVTFRRTDPLYVLDLSNPADPKTAGVLEVPGYSDYLYPMGDDLLLGVGKDANGGGVVQGLQVALMDVSDSSQPKLLSSVALGKRGSASALDVSSRGINIFQQGGTYRVGLPVRLNETPIANTGGFFNPTVQGLARFEVNTQTKTLTAKPTVVSLTFSTSANSFSQLYGQYDLAQDRSVQIGSFAYYFSGGSFLVSQW